MENIVASMAMSTPFLAKDAFPVHDASSWHRALGHQIKCDTIRTPAEPPATARPTHRSRRTDRRNAPAPMDCLRVRDLIAHAGPRAAFTQLIEENDALIRGPILDNGRAIANARTAIYTELVRAWAAKQQRTLGYDRPFAVVALGGTGRGEMAPCSDNDFAFLFDQALERNLFLLELQRQVLHSNEFLQQYGFQCLALPFSLEDVPSLAEKQLNSFLDMRPVYDPTNLTDLFRQRIRSTFDPFEHFLHVRSFWKDQWEKAAGECERLDRFDIKNEGLRVFLAAIWTLSSQDFRHSHDIYETLDDPRDLGAYDFLMRLRAFIHLRATPQQRPGTNGQHPEDVLTFDDFLSFGELLGPNAGEYERFEFANNVRARLIAARRRIARFSKGVIERALKDGRPVSPGNPIVYGTGGLSFRTPTPPTSPQEKSRAALSMLQAAQHYGVAIDPSELETTFRNAGDWLVRGPELSALFYEQRGSLADSFAFLSQIDGAEERLFPGYARFESSVDNRVLAERHWLRNALERQKFRALDTFVRDGRKLLADALQQTRRSDPATTPSVPLEAALLDADHLAAVKLALKTKRLPLTEDDLAKRRNESIPLHQRFSSGFSEIPLPEYYAPFVRECDFTPETVRLTEFLVSHRRALQNWASAGINDAQQVADFARLCQDEQRLRALFVFAHADRSSWESQETQPALWFSIRELYVKTLQVFHPTTDASQVLATAGYSPDQLSVLQDFGQDFFGGVYQQYANRFGSHLVRLAESPDCTVAKASLLRNGTATILGVAARDYRGLAAVICGAFWQRQIEIRQAHLFSAATQGLALDFFHVASLGSPLPKDLPKFIETAIEQRRFIDDADAATLPKVEGPLSLQEWRPGQFCLRCETGQPVSGLLYALTFKVYRHLRGNIFGLNAHPGQHRTFVSVYHSLPPDLNWGDAQAILSDLT